MALVTDILKTFRSGPRPVLARHLARGPQEARALAFLMLGCGLVWLAQWPRLMREAELASGRGAVEGADFQQLAGTALVVWVMLMPLVFFLLAAVAHGASRALGGRGEPWTARLALFWAWLAASPMALLAGLAAGLGGSSFASNILAVSWIGVFVAFWSLGQREASARPVAA